MMRYGDIQVIRSGHTWKPRCIARFTANYSAVRPDLIVQGDTWVKVAPYVWGCQGRTMRYTTSGCSGGFQGFALLGPGTWAIPLVARPIYTYTSHLDVGREAMQALRAADWYVRTGLIPGWAVP